MEWIVYKLTRSDEKIYIGKTSKKKLQKRLYDHKNSERFKGFEFSYEILFESDSHDEILKQEKLFVEKYNSFYEGLNNSIDGAGNHNSPNFTTLGLKFSEETREKIRQKALGNKRTLGFKHKKETKENWSKLRKGKVWSKKFEETVIKEIMLLFKNTPKTESTISKNGKKLNYIRKFCNETANLYDMSPRTMYNILTGKTIAWELLYKEILDTKF